MYINSDKIDDDNDDDDNNDDDNGDDDHYYHYNFFLILPLCQSTTFTDDLEPFGITNGPIIQRRNDLRNTQQACCCSKTFVFSLILFRNAKTTTARETFPPVGYPLSGTQLCLYFVLHSS